MVWIELTMQFKTKLGLVDIPNEEVLRAAAEIRGRTIAAFDAMEDEQRAEFEEHKRRCTAPRDGGAMESDASYDARLLGKKPQS